MLPGLGEPQRIGPLEQGDSPNAIGRRSGRSLGSGRTACKHSQQRQAETNYQNTELLVQVEVRQAYARYELAQRQLAQYNDGLLTQAERVLAGKTYSYRRGNASLLDVLNAQRTLNDVYLSFYQAQQNLATTWVELQRATGLWKIKL
ncbi:hypothetical protein GCM10027594_34360 [Hymenobacter agri]